MREALMAAQAQVGLPAGWEWDYDGSRWLYRYKSTGHEQYHFPSAGDEFPDYVDCWAPPPDLAPEERLESQQQVRRHAGRNGRLFRMREDGEEVEVEGEGERGDGEEEEQDVGTDKDDEGGEGDEKSRARKLWAAKMSAAWEEGRAAEDGAKRASEEEEEEEGRRRDDAGEEGRAVVLRSGSLPDISPLAEEDEGLRMQQQLERAARRLMLEEAARRRLSAGFSDEGTLVATQDLGGTLSSMMVEVGGIRVHGGSGGGGGDDEEEEEEFLKSEAGTRGPEATLERQRSVRQPFDPVGLLAEMATEQTAPAKAELYPDPIEMADNTILAPIETHFPFGVVDLQGRLRSDSTSKGSVAQQGGRKASRWEEVDWRRQKSLEELFKFVDVRCDIQALDNILSLVRGQAGGAAEDARGSVAAPGAGRGVGRSMSRRERPSMSSSVFTSPPMQSVPTMPPRAGEAGGTMSGGPPPPEFLPILFEQPESQAGDWTQARSVFHGPAMAPGERNEATRDLAPTTNALGPGDTRYAAQMSDVSSLLEPSPLMSGALPALHGRPFDAIPPIARLAATPESAKDSPTLGRHAEPHWQLHQRQASEPERVKPPPSLGSVSREESQHRPALVEPFPSLKLSATPSWSEGHQGPVHPDHMPQFLQSRQTSFRTTDEGSTGFDYQELVAAAFARRPLRPPQTIFVHRPPPRRIELSPPRSSAAERAPSVSPGMRPSEYPTSPPLTELDWILSPDSQDTDGLDLYLDTVYPPAVSPLLVGDAPSPLISGRRLQFSSAETLANSSSTTLSHADGSQDRPALRPQTPYHPSPLWLPDAELAPGSQPAEPPQPIPEKHPLRPSMLHPQQFALPPQAGTETAKQITPSGGDEAQIDEQRQPPSPEQRQPSPEQRQPSPDNPTPEPSTQEDKKLPPVPLAEPSPPFAQVQTVNSPTAASPQGWVQAESKKIFQRLSLPPKHARFSLSSGGEKKSSSWTKWFKPSRLNRQSVPTATAEADTKIYSPVDIPPPREGPTPYSPNDFREVSSSSSPPAAAAAAPPAAAPAAPALAPAAPAVATVAEHDQPQQQQQQQAAATTEPAPRTPERKTTKPRRPRAVKTEKGSGHRKGESGSISPASANSSIRPSGDFSVLRPLG